MAGWQRQEAAESTVDGPIVGFSWTLPSSRRRRAHQGRAEARLTAAEARLELLQSQNEAGRAGARGAYEHLAQAAHAAHAATAGNAALAQAVTSAFRYGETDLTDLLETLRSALASELTALELHAAALAAHRELEAATGRPLTPFEIRRNPS